MDVIHSIDCDLTGYRLQVVEVAHNDRGTRRVRCRLFANDAPWTVPEGVAVAVSYTLPDGTPGLYAVPSAVVESNTVTVGLSDQLLGAAGAVEAAVVLGLDGNQLATFPFRIHVIGEHGLTNAATYPVLGAEFEGKLLFGGPGGRVKALMPGPGLEVVGNVLRLKVAGAGELPAAPTFDSLQLGDETGVSLYPEGTAMAPALTLYGTHGDEPVQLNNVADATDDRSVPNLGQVKRLIGSGEDPGDFQTDETLTLKDGVLSVNTTNNMEQDNTLPITSAGVFATVGNIEALLETI